MTANDHVSLWGGRFSGAPADALSALSVSTHFDWRLAGADIAGSHAHADALHAVGLLSDDEARRMHEALRRLDDDVREAVEAVQIVSAIQSASPFEKPEAAVQNSSFHI